MIQAALISLLLLFTVSIPLGCGRGNSTPPHINVDYYPEIANAPDGTSVTVRGYIDATGICTDHSTAPNDSSCETAIFTRCPFAYMPIRLTYCSNERDANCILRRADAASYNDWAASLDYLRDVSSKPFPPGQEVELTVSVARKENGWTFARSVDRIEIIEGSFDPVNECPTPR